MSRYTLQRLVGMAAVTFIVVTIVLLIVRVTPGDLAAVMLGPDHTESDSWPCASALASASRSS